MGWEKGKHTLKDELLADFEAAVPQLSDVMTRYPPQAGIAALAYLVACVQIAHPKKDFDRMVNFYAGKIKSDVLDELTAALKGAGTEKGREMLAELRAGFAKARGQ